MDIKITVVPAGTYSPAYVEVQAPEGTFFQAASTITNISMESAAALVQALAPVVE